MSNSRRKPSFTSDANIIDVYSLIRKTLAAGNTIDIASAGDSMFPLIKEASMCSFAQIIPSELKKGDIVLFASADHRLIGHRFMGRDSVGNYICKGDANLHPDAPIEESQLIGKLQFIRRNNYVLHADGWICSIWGFIIRSVPLLPRLFRKYLLLTSIKQ
ncbi:S24/S26 family peptidase [Paenibacillus sedimenti]|uniref:S24/S26 family peptidase n=1 Tax=Paenibacillus sedimenti TaxID=2770274 RepID=A0A926KL51_9BACL|nr:S24/S26 family peptidase [Paenibacillus sedimenti]MBD0379817.1 S24/S26 family peptidase [Paenibacillus sedimenti]